MDTVRDVIDRVVEKMSTVIAPPGATDAEVAAEIVRLGGHGYIPSESIIEPVRAYLSGYGLLLSGDAGVGKTLLMRNLGVHLCVADEITEWGLSRIRWWYDWTDGYEICIDDLGSERVVAEYGAKDDLLKAVLAHRADSQKGKTHITTNLDAEEIAHRYGDRVLSRILGMCKPFRLEGKNRREARKI